MQFGRALVTLILVAGCGRVGVIGTGAVTASTAESPTSPAPPSCGDEAVDPDAVVASWDGGSITWAQISARTDDDLRNMEIQHRISRYELQQQALDDLIVDQLLEAEAKRRGLASVDALLVQEVEDKVPDPTEQQVADFYPVVERQLGGATLDEARPYLKQELKRRAQQEAYQAYIDRLRDAAGVKADLPYPDLPRVDVPIDPDDPVRGSADARVTIVQFAEYQCYYCGKVNPTVDEVMKKYDGKVRLVFKDFPLQMHSRAMPAAVAARCVGEQGKYWEYNRLLLENQQALSDADLQRYASQVGADVDQFQNCLANNRYEQAIQGDLDAGRKAGVSATPAFFVDGILLSGAQPLDRFSAVIDRELTR